MEVPRLGVELELLPLAYATAVTMPDLSHVCDLHNSSWQLWILNPLSEVRDRTCILMDANQIHLWFGLGFRLTLDPGCHLDSQSSRSQRHWDGVWGGSLCPSLLRSRVESLVPPPRPPPRPGPGVEEWGGPWAEERGAAGGEPGGGGMG